MRRARLVIELSEAGKTLVGSLPKGLKWATDIVLTTVPFDGKQTFEIYNRATLHSDGSEWDYWSEESSEATSYGDEAEMRKRVFDAESTAWVPGIDALIKDGKFVNDTFIYSIELIPRGNYGSAFPVTIFPREDVLPSAVEFLGFVGLDADGVPVLGSATSDPQDMNGNVSASYADGVVTIRQQDGTSLNPDDGRILVHFAVQANDASQMIVNSIAGSEATITPVGDPSIDIEKWNDEGSAPEYDATGALLNDKFDGDFDKAPGKPLAVGTPLEINFTVSNDGREELVDVVVSDQLTAGKGKIEKLVCVFPDNTTGIEWKGPFAIGTQFDCTGTLPGLEPGQTHSDRATVTAVGVHSGISVDDEDDWHGFTAAAVVKDGLSTTGSALPLWFVGGAALLLLAGSALLVARRRSVAVEVDATE